MTHKSNPQQCPVLCWYDGPKCELPYGHQGQHTPARDPNHKFHGPVASSRTLKGHHPYTVTITKEDIATCTCDAYTKYRRGQDCSHIKFVREALNQP